MRKMLSDKEDRNGVDAVNLTSRVVMRSNVDRTISLDKGQDRLRPVGAIRISPTSVDMIVDDEKVLAAHPTGDESPD
jgi:hypothetical protein